MNNNDSRDAYRAYVNTIASIPVLSEDEEQTLLKQYHQTKDTKIKNKLVEHCLKYVVSVAREYNGYNLPITDLIQEGNIALMKAIDKYDPAHGVRLVSYAVSHIKAAMNEYAYNNVREFRMVTTKPARKLFFNLRSLRSGEGWLKDCDVKRIAKELDVSEHDVKDMEAKMFGKSYSLNMPENGDDDHSFNPIQFLAVDGANPADIVERFDYDQDRLERLSNGLASLSDRERHIVKARWLNDDHSAPLHDLASIYGISAERVRQLEAKAFKTIKQQFS